MKQFFITIAMMFACCTPAHALSQGGELTTSVHYLDDQGPSLSPYAGVHAWQDLSSALQVSEEVGGGYLQLPNVNGSYTRIGGDVSYKYASWKFGVGGAIESNPSLLKEWDDYVHVTASVRLW